MFARTERLLLRPGWVDDAPALHEAIAHEAVATKLARLPWPYSLEDAQAYLSRPFDRHAPQFLMFARTAGKPRLVGGIGLELADCGAELGYWLAPQYWGLGFATEGGRAVVDIARESLRLPRLIASHFIDNPASGHVLRKLGFERTGKVVERHCASRGRAIASPRYVLDLAEDSGCPDDNMGERTLLAA